MPIKTMRKISAKALWLLLFLPTISAADTSVCRKDTFEGLSYTVCEVSQGADLRLFHRDANGAVYGSFQRIDAQLAAHGQKLLFAMNAGMYHSDRSPVGLYIENTTTEGALMTAAGPGNFGMRPNGVFCIKPDGGFGVIETLAFAKQPPDCSYATQSGPMLVIDNALHPRFLADSSSRYTRNGVGVSADGRRAVFAISDQRVTFHEFARYFRDGLGLPQALYFDGNISRLHAPMVGRSDFGFPMGPVVGLVGPNQGSLD